MTITQKINEIEKEITDHHYDKYIITSKSISENFAARLGQAKKNTYFDEKLKNVSKNVTLNKKKMNLLKMDYMVWQKR